MYIIIIYSILQFLHSGRFFYANVPQLIFCCLCNAGVSHFSTHFEMRSASHLPCILLVILCIALLLPNVVAVRKSHTHTKQRIPNNKLHEAELIIQKETETIRTATRTTQPDVPSTEDVNSAPNYYVNSHWCGGSEEYLSDSKCVKVFPSSFSRDWVSPLWASIIPPANEGWAMDTGNFEDIHVNTTALNEYLQGEANLCLILIKRWKGPSPSAGVYFKYYCSEGDTTNAYQPWSSTKIYAAANAGGHIREVCPDHGLISSTTGEHGVTPLGDLMTIITSYDSTMDYTSNGLSFYMHDLGGRYRLLDQLQAWYPTQKGNLSLGGNYVNIQRDIHTHTSNIIDFYCECEGRKENFVHVLLTFSRCGSFSLFSDSFFFFFFFFSGYACSS
jgi:hypothetical protein